MRNAHGSGEVSVAEGCRDDLIVAATRAKEIAEFTMLSTEARGGGVAFEALHTLDPALDAAMVLFKTIVPVSTGPVQHALTEDARIALG